MPGEYQTMGPVLLSIYFMLQRQALTSTVESVNMNAPAVAAETRHSPSAAPAAGTRVAVQPVILAGGSGTRLWPMSRERFPKQLIGLLGEHSLLQSTALRLDGLAGDHPLTTTC